jgi:hypothetical protein
MMAKQTCTYCEEPKEDVIDGLCEDCERCFVFCSVCREKIHEDNALYRHRHLHRIEGGWIGTGGADTPEYLNEIQASVCAILNKVPDIARPLADTIRRGEMGFDTMHFFGTTFGYSGLWLWLRADDEEGGQSYGDQIMDGLDDTEEDAMSFGINWLIGLDSQTDEANKMTLEWIEANDD